MDEFNSVSVPLLISGPYYKMIIRWDILHGMNNFSFLLFPSILCVTEQITLYLILQFICSCFIFPTLAFKLLKNGKLTLITTVCMVFWISLACIKCLVNWKQCFFLTMTNNCEQILWALKKKKDFYIYFGGKDRVRERESENLIFTPC